MILSRSYVVHIRAYIILLLEFSHAIKRLKDIQKDKLINDGLYGGREVNSTMAIFLLKVNHGMVEKNQTDITTQGEKLPVPILGGLSVK